MVEPAKLLRRLGLPSGSESWRMWRKSSGGGGGNGSSWLGIRTSSGPATVIGGGGGRSGLGIRRSGFLGGRSGTQSSSEISGPMTIGPSWSFEV